VINHSTLAHAHPNIAFIKYWGNRNHELRLPSNGSISMNLASLETRTELKIIPEWSSDTLWLNNERQSGASLERVQKFLDIVRSKSHHNLFSEVRSENNFPHSAGIASSASGFAALTVAAVKEYGLNLSEKDQSRLARRGSGSACRSIPSGFVEWHAGTADEDSFSVSIAPSSHWELWDLIAIVDPGIKEYDSTTGHLLAETSQLQHARVMDSIRRLEICRKAILSKDFESLADIIELDSHMLHAVMMTSRPSLFYWSPISILVMKEVAAWRKKGIPAAYTLDAGPNVHVICTADSRAQLLPFIQEIPGVQKVVPSPVGEGAEVIH